MLSAILLLRKCKDLNGGNGCIKKAKSSVVCFSACRVDAKFIHRDLVG